jgi:secreted PhoX family phosphatase
MKVFKLRLATGLITGVAFLAACSGTDGAAGANGAEGDAGTPGSPGSPGAAGQDGKDGTNGSNGSNGSDGPAGPAGPPGAPGKGAIDPRYPLSSMVAVMFVDAEGTGARNIAEFVKARVRQYRTKALPPGVQFPLASATTDTVRVLDGLSQNVVVSWLDPLKWDRSPNAPRFGANADYLAYFGDGWEAGGNAPQFAGSGSSAWIWSNHEYISGAMPTATTAPTGHVLFLAQVAQTWGLLTNDVASNTWAEENIGKFVARAKTEVGGSWFHVVQDPATGEWHLDRGADNKRYDATSGTLAKLTGATLSGIDKTDKGEALPANVVPGITGNCSGGQTPWGTVITAEENVQDYYGDLEAAWTSDQKFVPGKGFDPGADVTFDFTPSTSGEYGRTPDANARHLKDGYGWLVEIDPGKAADEFEGKTTAGDGHKKLGVLGRARWENATFATGDDWKLIPGEPVVIYAADDRRGGRIFKFVSSKPFAAGMTKAQTRALLDEGKLYAAHFEGLDNLTGDTLVSGGDANKVPTEAAPGTGKWIELSVDSADIAPNATALGTATKTVGAALKDQSWNGIGGFPTDLAVKRALFTVTMKLGIMELNRPEDLEYNPRDPSGTPRIYVAFTNHGRKTGLDQAGKLIPPASHDADSKVRDDRVGSIFAIEEIGKPGAAKTFKYLRLWKGTRTGSAFGTANPDNLMIDRDGGVWFGTDGAFGTAKTADALYYLDLDPAHKSTAGGNLATFGLAFRVVAGPSDSEATGPAFSSDMRTIFFNVQHPGEDNFSTWPAR